MARILLLLPLLTLARGDNSPLSVLRQALFHSYDKAVIPQQFGDASPPLVIQLGLAPKWFDLDSNGVLTATLWLRLVWSDFRLTWDPEEHEGITSLQISPANLWKPDIALYNKQDLDHGILAADPRSASTNVHIHSNGNILWILPVSHKVLCEGVTYSNWPWGRQTCNLNFGSWTHDSAMYDLQFYDGQEEMDLRQFGEYNQFKILQQTATRLATQYDCCPNPYVNLNFLFSLRRKYVVDPDLGRIDNPTGLHR